MLLNRKGGSSKSSSPGSTNLDKYCITSKFGDRVHPITKKKSFHNGLDLAVPANTKLYAPNDSTIVKAFYNKLGGNQLIYRLKNGVTVGYAHLNKLNVKTGDKVKKGVILALSGNTGTSTGAHLHVTVRRADGTLVDPTPYFKVANCKR